MTPDQILPTYQRVATAFAQTRDTSLFEAAWLDKMMALAPAPKRVLDLGCGTGEPIARYLSQRGAAVTGVDGAAAMITLFRQALPDCPAIRADMRRLDLDQRFDAILAWNSFFHLAPEDQRAMFGRFAAHAAKGAALMFTAGPKAGAPIGDVAGHPVYHASLDPGAYRALLKEHEFSVLEFMPEDPACRGHSVWLARFDGAEGESVED